MGKIKKPEKVKPFVGLLLSAPYLLEEVKKTLELHFAPIEFESQIIPFLHTNYYNPEMGEHICRVWVSFSGLFDPGNLSEWKIRSNRLEEAWAENRANKLQRRINIDPGYVSDSKIVLASTKNYSHRIYVGSGIYAEVTLNYRKKGGWRFHNWTYPDYKEKAALDFFILIKNQLLSEKKACKSS